ncbi:hypothetical protein RvY_07000 [Ramazzottius varieornatus]|uniref:Amyloid-beta-like protein n=1 Tax=Ramazzottius varieornatus TaxID=947166 RepID=A0A1D1V0V2_RAMVA|nr:hypothetical protein RvY_07000 [Ramazzottius varieornatus]
MVIRGLACLLCLTLVIGAPTTTEEYTDRLKTSFEPEVAVKCGYLNSYMNEKGHWAPNKDGDATCVTRKDEILAICRKAYPERDITNIVEAPSTVNILNLCKDGEDVPMEKCSHRAWVRPYRCIEGSFQSDALLVPEGCNFSHTYDKRQCKDSMFWNVTSQEACALKGKVVRSFGMLVPCGISLFSGVEYVCCPLAESKRIPVPREDEEALEEERSRSRHSLQHGKPQSSDEHDNGDDWQAEYFRADDEETEHERFKTAMEKLKKHHQERIDKLMKEWTDVAGRYKALKKADPQGAKKLKSDLMARVRKTVTAYETEFDDQKRQLVDLHQQRIEVRLNDKKRESMDAYLDAIQESGTHPKEEKLLRTLQRYIRAEEKDREHSLSQYRHLLHVDPDAADEQEATVTAHLNDLDQRINESMKMLNRVPDAVGKSVEAQARIYWDDLRSDLFGAPEMTNGQLVLQYKQQVAADRTRKKISKQKELEEKFDLMEETAEDDDEDDDVQVEPENEKSTPSTTTSTTTTTTEEAFIDEEGLNFEPLDRKKSMAIQDVVEVFTTTSPTTTTVEVEDEDDEDDISEDESVTDEPSSIDTNDKLDSTDTERESETVDLRKFQDINSAAYKVHREDQPQYSKLERLVQEDTSTNNRLAYIGFGLAGVALLAGLLLAVVLLRRRSPAKDGFAPVDTFASPEERHVANMQAHGYTNPFFNHVHQYSKA